MSTNRDLKKNRVYICSALFKKKASDSEFNINHHLSMLDNKDISSSKGPLQLFSDSIRKPKELFSGVNPNALMDHDEYN